MSSITVSAHHTTLLAIDEQSGFFNSSLLARQFNKNPKEFLCTSEAYTLLNAAAATLGKSINEKWQNLQYVRINKPQYFDALKDAKVIIGYAGTPGMRVPTGKNIAGSIPDYQPGLWFHPNLAADFIQWMEPFSYRGKESSLTPFVEQALSSYLKQECANPKAKRSVADDFADAVGEATLKQLRTMDQILMDTDATDNERYQIIQDRVARLIQAEAE